jgi:hypothetical protein
MTPKDRWVLQRFFFFLGIIAIILGIITNLGLLFVSVYPKWQRWRMLDLQVERAREQLRERESRTAEDVQREIDETRQSLTERTQGLLTREQAIQAFNTLYDYARESGINIRSVQGSPFTEVDAGPYDVRTFKIQASGTSTGLLAFIGRIEETAVRGFLLTNIVILDGEEGQLTMDVILTTSPYAATDAVP